MIHYSIQMPVWLTLYLFSFAKRLSTTSYSLFLCAPPSSILLGIHDVDGAFLERKLWTLTDCIWIHVVSVLMSHIGKSSG